MKLLIILLAMAAACGGALHSWHSRSLFVQAALLSEAFSVSAPVKLRVSDHYVQNGVMPHDNADAGLPPPKSIYGSSVKRVAINRGGVLIVDFDAEIGRQAMTFTPTVSTVSGMLGWHCTSDSIDRGVLERMKPSCSYLPATRESRLMHAIANRDAARVAALLDEGVAADTVVNGNTPLMLAAKIGELTVVDSLLAANASVDNATLNSERRTPLMVAITSNKPDVVGLLLARGASATRKDHRGMSALDHAVATDRRLGGERYTLLVSARFNPNFAGAGIAGVSDGSSTPDPLARETELAALYDEFRGAASDCHVKRLGSLLRAEGDLDAPEIVAGEPLANHIKKPACRSVLATHLLDKRSYRLARDARFRVAVDACESRNVDEMLRENPSIDVSRMRDDAPGEATPFEQAVSAGCTSVASLMIRERNLSGNLDDEILLHAIRRAPQESLVRLVGTLIAAGANVDVRDADGRTPLGEAIALEQPVVAKYLVDAGADVNARTFNGSRPVIEATKKGFGHLLSELIQRGADIESRDTLGRTALLAAVASGRQLLVDELVRAGANVHHRDQNGIDAMVLAESRNMRQIRSILTASLDD